MIPEVIPLKEPRSLAGLAVKPPAVFLPNEKAGGAVLWLLHRPRSQQEHGAHYKAADCCAGRGLCELPGVKPAARGRLDDVAIKVVTMWHLKPPKRLSAANNLKLGFGCCMAPVQCRTTDSVPAVTRRTRRRGSRPG